MRLTALIPALKFAFLLVAIMSIVGSLQGQIVNVESLRKQTDTTGFAGGIEFNGTFLDNEKVIYNFQLLPHIQYKWERDLLLVVGDYKLTKSDDVSFEDAAFLHFRHNHEYTDLFRWETFTQIQHNKVTKLEYRILVGTGPRLKVLGKENFRIYLGVIPMYQYERIQDEARTIEDNVRLSNYLSFTVNLSNQAQLYSTSYYQPIWNKWRDHRFYNEQKLSVKLVGDLNLTVATVYTWDSRPPEAAPARTLQVKTGLLYRF